MIRSQMISKDSEMREGANISGLSISQMATPLKSDEKDFFNRIQTRLLEKKFGKIDFPTNRSAAPRNHRGLQSSIEAQVDSLKIRESHKLSVHKFRQL